MAGSTELTTLKTLVSDISPIIGSLIGSPFSSLILSALGTKFGVNGSALGSLIDAVGADIEGVITSIKQLEAEHETALNSATKATNPT